MTDVDLLKDIRTNLANYYGARCHDEGMLDAFAAETFARRKTEAESTRLREAWDRLGGVKDCHQCRGAGQVQDSTEGGVWITCACVRVIVDAEVKKRKAVEAELAKCQAIMAAALTRARLALKEAATWLVPTPVGERQLLVLELCAAAESVASAAHAACEAPMDAPA